MDEQTKRVFIGFGIGVILFGSFLYVMRIRDYNINRSYEFRGLIENITYDVKGIPEITVNGKMYYLSGDYDFRHDLQKGDSIEKKKDSDRYILIKRITKERIVF